MDLEGYLNPFSSANFIGDLLNTILLSPKDRSIDSYDITLTVVIASSMMCSLQLNEAFSGKTKLVVSSREEGPEEFIYELYMADSFMQQLWCTLPFSISLFTRRKVSGHRRRR